MKIEFYLNDVNAETASTEILKKIEVIEKGFDVTCASVRAGVSKSSIYMDEEDYSPESIKSELGKLNDNASYYVEAQFTKIKQE